MKILAIGDFHGKFPAKLKQKLKKEKFDIILSPGDFGGNEKLAKLFFKYEYGKDEASIPKKIKKEMDRLEIVSTARGINILNELKKLKKSTYAIRGNWDPKSYNFDIGTGHQGWMKSYIKKFNSSSKGIHLIDFKYNNLKDFVLLGGACSTYPGKVKDKSTKKEHNRRKKIYEGNFKKAKKTSKPTIFLTHNCPYRTKLDKIKKGPQKGKHYGSYLEKEMIKKYEPNLVICGHIHEGKGKQKIGRTLVVNPGAAVEGRAAIIDTETLNVKFLK